jgi:dTDP-4-dehydrorhamnose reductase
LVTGAGGQLGAYLLDELRGERVTAWSGRADVDLADPRALDIGLRFANPDIILHAAALARVDDCRRDPALARQVNVEATARLAAFGGRFAFVSTDLVFDGERAPYREGDARLPLSVYGRTKADAEAAVLAVPGTAIVRVSLLAGPSKNGRPNFWDDLADALRAGRPATLFADEWRTPLAYADAARALVTLARSDAAGVWHAGGPERLSRLDMGRRLAAALGVSDAPLVAGERNAGAAEPRPADVSLDSAKFRAAFPAWRPRAFDAIWP